ncbi:MAG: ABC transporter permease, partial [Proteobacteria bacterium]|nr:ABC transporter permease [Pseudomonadota bacterium]
TMLDLATSGMGTRYLKPLQLVENAIDWSLEDRGLLAIRGRTHFSRTLNPLDRDSQLFWEYLNYGLPLCGLLLIALIHKQTNKRAAARYAAVLGMTEKSRA